jgi:Skp family chaperone for outer membrane proteins
MMYRWTAGLWVTLGLVLSSESLMAQQRTAPSQQRPVGNRAPAAAAVPSPRAPVASTSAPSGGINIALVDVSYVFKNHERFKARTEELRQEIKDFETQMNDQRKGLNEKRTRLSNYNPGSPQYEQLEVEMAREIANQNVNAELKKKDVLEREARIYHEVYLEIQEAVRQFAEQYNIALVLRYDGEEIDPNDRNSVLRGVNRSIVYQDKINITYEILQMLNAPRTATRPR